MTESTKNPRIRSQRIADRTLCVVRSVWYSLADRIRLCLARRNYRTSDAAVIVKRRFKPLISIIIPTRDRWDVLRDRVIPSIINQTYKNWELIIVDDGSEEEPISIYHYLLKGYPKSIDDKVDIYSIYKDFHYPKNAWCRWCAGPVKALNFALSKVKGDYILRMNDHDVLESTALKDLLILIRAKNVEFVSGVHIANDRIVRPYRIRGKLFGGIQTTLMRSYLKCFGYNPDCWRKKWNSPNELDLTDRMLKAGVETAYTETVISHIKPRPGEGNKIGWQAAKEFYVQE